MTPEQEREARLRAVRMMQDDIYEGIGGERRYGPGGEAGVPRERGNADMARAEARDLGRTLATGGTQPLRDELDRERRASAKSKAKGY